jgi:hypothetical protein
MGAPATDAAGRAALVAVAALAAWVAVVTARAEAAEATAAAGDHGLDILARYNFTGLFSGRRPYLQRPRPEAREGACTWW